MKILRKILLLMSPWFLGYLLRKILSAVRWLLIDYAAYQRPRKDFGPSSWRMDLHVRYPERLAIHPTANIGRGVRFSAETLPPEDRARLQIGEAAFIGEGVELGLTPGCSLLIGDHTSMHGGTVILGNVRIGRYCILSYNIYIASGGHIIDRQPTWLIKDQDDAVGSYRDPEDGVTIEDDVWLGWGVFVKTGVTIGKGCVVGANSVVTSSLAPYGVYAGAPARKIGQRLEFSPPESISANTESHLPYFYRGFQVNQRALEQSRKNDSVMLCDAACVMLGAKKAAQRLVIDGLWLEHYNARLRIAVNKLAAGEVSLDSGKFSSVFDIPVLLLSQHDPLEVKVYEIELSVIDADPRSLGISRVALI